MLDQGREWGLLGMLYLMLQVIRSAVVVLLLPALTKWGYGMTYKELLVLAFSGLRGERSGARTGRLACTLFWPSLGLLFSLWL